MNERDMMIGLIEKAKRSMWGESGLSCALARNSYIAEHLIANGVIVPPVRIGQTVYLIRRPFHHEPYISDEVVERVRIEYTKDGILRKFGNRSFEAYDIDFGETVFLTREEAEQALKERG